LPSIYKLSAVNTYVILANFTFLRTFIKAERSF